MSSHGCVVSDHLYSFHRSRRYLRLMDSLLVSFSSRFSVFILVQDDTPTAITLTQQHHNSSPLTSPLDLAMPLYDCLSSSFQLAHPPLICCTPSITHICAPFFLLGLLARNALDSALHTHHPRSTLVCPTNPLALAIFSPQCFNTQ